MTIRLQFSERVVPLRSGVRLRTPHGARQDARIEIVGSAIVVRFTARESGTYVVTYRVIDDDTHISRGLAEFTVERASEVTAGVAGQSAFAGGLSRTLEAAARWLHYAGFAALFGVVACAVLLRRLGSDRSIDVRTLRAGIALMLVADALAIFAQSIAFEPKLLFDLDAVGDVAGSDFGRLIGIDAAGALMAWAVLPLVDTSRPLAERILLVEGIVLALVAGRLGHAIRGVPWELSTFLGAAHIGAMALWLGAVLLPPPRADAARIVAAALAIAALSGLALLLGHAGNVVAFFTSGYGLAITEKIVLVAGAIAAGATVAPSAQASAWLAAERAALCMALLAAGYALTLVPPR